MLAYVGSRLQKCFHICKRYSYISNGHFLFDHQRRWWNCDKRRENVLILILCPTTCKPTAVQWTTVITQSGTWVHRESNRHKKLKFLYFANAVGISYSSKMKKYFVLLQSCWRSLWRNWLPLRPTGKTIVHRFIVGYGLNFQWLTYNN